MMRSTKRLRKDDSLYPASTPRSGLETFTSPTLADPMSSRGGGGSLVSQRCANHRDSARCRCPGMMARPYAKAPAQATPVQVKYYHVPNTVVSSWNWEPLR
jgi:hypothetical protein